MTVLYWIQNQGEWKQFVRHRVNEILQLSDESDWGHCSSGDNPADIGSRGTSAKELSNNELWWHGPSWLTEPIDHRPTRNLIEPTAESKEEGKRTAILTVISHATNGIDRVMEIKGYSTLRKLCRVTAWVKRFCSNIFQKDKNVRKQGRLSLEGIVASENEWARAAQRVLKRGDHYQRLVTSFGLQKDDNNIVRFKGRSTFSELLPEAREPVILP